MRFHFIFPMRKGRCDGKIRYGRLATAERACMDMEAKGRPGLSSYFCPKCKGYHIGHRPRMDLLFAAVEASLNH